MGWKLTDQAMPNKLRLTMVFRDPILKRHTMSLKSSADKLPVMIRYRSGKWDRIFCLQGVRVYQVHYSDTGDAHIPSARHVSYCPAEE